VSGEVVWAQVPGDKIRPVVIITRTRIIRRLHSVVVAPVTSTERNIGTEVRLGPAEGVRDGSVANLDNLMLISRSTLGPQVGQVSAERWPEFCRAAAALMAC
jgi:mRNA interferase MazF